MKLSVSHHSYIYALPVFLLGLSVGLDIGWIMAAALLLHIDICVKNRESVWGTMWKSPLFMKSWLFIALFLGTILLSWLFNQGDLKEIGHYGERVAPFLLLGMIACEDVDVPKMLWIGLTVSVAYICGDTFLHPAFIDGRLRGTFGEPTGLAAVLTTLLPVVLFGIVKYRQEMTTFSIFAGATFLIGAYINVLTGARSAIITMVVILLVLTIFCVKCYGIKVFKFAIPAMLIFGIFISCFSGNLLKDRFQEDVRNDGRVYLMQVSKDIFMDNPVFGIGTKKWGDVYHEQYEYPHAEKGVQSPHNIFLHSVNENGLVGLAGFLSLLIFQYWSLLKRGIIISQNNVLQLKWTAGLFLGFLAILIDGQFDYGFYGRHVMSLFWLYWGISVYVLQKEEKQKVV